MAQDALEKVTQLKEKITQLEEKLHNWRTN